MGYLARSLIRNFFPSWVFFDRFGYSPNLFYRFKTKDEVQSDWLLASKPPKRNFLNFFINPEGNYSLVLQSLLEEILNEAQELNENEVPSLTSKTSYKLISSWVKSLLRPLSSEIISYQFKIVAHSGISNSRQEEDALISPQLLLGEE